MNVHYVYKWCLVAALAALGTNLGFQKAFAAPPAPAAANEGAQVLTRGPVHEAFAETVTFDPQPGMASPKRRPPPSKNCRLNSDWPGTTSHGSPATGPGTTNETTSCGSAASGAICRLAANGCPAIGASPRKAINGRPAIGPTPR